VQNLLNAVVKFHALEGLKVLSTLMVANLTDDNNDGQINENDVPDIVFATLPAGQFDGGTIKAISGDDGHEIFTAGEPNLVAALGDIAVGDIDGDGLPEIVAAHSDGKHLIAFEHTGAFKWLSDEDVLPGRSDSGGTIAGGDPGGGGDGEPPPTVDLEALVVDVVLTPPQNTAGQGTAAVYTVIVTNAGDETDTYVLSGSFPAGFSGVFAKPTVTVPPGLSNFREVQLTLTPPLGASAGDRNFSVSATSITKAGVSDTAAGSVVVAQNGVDVDMSPSSGAPDSTFQMAVRNTGQVSDTCDLALERFYLTAPWERGRPARCERRPRWSRSQDASKRKSL